MRVFFIKTTFITVFMKMQNLTLPRMYSQMLCLNNWDAFHNPAEKDCSLGLRCGGDCEIFLESGCAAGGNANTMFALAGKRHGCRL